MRRRGLQSARGRGFFPLPSGHEVRTEQPQTLNDRMAELIRQKIVHGEFRRASACQKRLW